MEVNLVQSAGTGAESIRKGNDEENQKERKKERKKRSKKATAEQ